MYNTRRGLLKYLLLGFITFGIYGLVVLSHISEEINIIASPRDKKHTMHFLLIFFIFSPLTLGICRLVWYHRLSKRIGEELQARGIDYTFGASDFWLWNILGSLILVGPFVYVHKLMKAMNHVNMSFISQGK